MVDRRVAVKGGLEEPQGIFGRVAGRIGGPV